VLLVRMPFTLRLRAECDNELKLESARSGVIWNHILSRAKTEIPVSFSTSVGTKQQSRLKYSHSLMSIPFPHGRRAYRLSLQQDT
jgi:hypothetical protein